MPALDCLCEYELGLARRLIDGLKALPRVRIMGITEHNRMSEPRADGVLHRRGPRARRHFEAAGGREHLRVGRAQLCRRGDPPPWDRGQAAGSCASAWRITTRRRRSTRRWTCWRRCSGGVDGVGTCPRDGDGVRVDARLKGGRDGGVEETQRNSRESTNLPVMAGLEPAIRANTGQVAFAWMLGSSPSMTDGWRGNGFMGKKVTNLAALTRPDWRRSAHCPG